MKDQKIYLLDIKAIFNVITFPSKRSWGIRAELI